MGTTFKPSTRSCVRHEAGPLHGVHGTFKCAPEMTYDSSSMETFYLVLKRVDLGTHKRAHITHKNKLFALSGLILAISLIVGWDTSAAFCRLCSGGCL